MLENIYLAEELTSLSRRKSQVYEYKTVLKQLRDQYESEGWQVCKENKSTYRLMRGKRNSVLLEDRVWTLLYKMGFTHLSGDGGAKLLLAANNSDGPANQIDVVGVDSEVALAVECKTQLQPKKNTQFPSFLTRHSAIRQNFANSVHKQFKIDHKRIPVLALFTENFILSDNDIERAKCDKIILFNENDLTYYEQLVNHLGPAAKYQFFADMLPGKPIHGLTVKIPAVRSKMGKYTCYNFTIAPEYLLKIAYVSHRLKGKASDVDTYQRMVKKSRLRSIREYISKDGIFPTNLVISFENKNHLDFNIGVQDDTLLKAKFGTLILRPTYRSAWIIDGQHRLFAYSGHNKAPKDHLNVLAFEGLPASVQAQLFIDINHEQKSVKRNLLHELYAELNWNAEDEGKRISAIISKSIQVLNEEKDSSFYDRIMLTDAVRTETRCISLECVFNVMNQPGFFIIKKGIEYGPLWAGDNEKTLKRSVFAIKSWFNFIREGCQDWWHLGSAEGGGLAMNDGVTVCFGMLKNVFNHLTEKKINLLSLSEKELAQSISKYGKSLGEYLGNLSAEDRQLFRVSGRGGQGQMVNRRKLEAALNKIYSDFEPKGLKEYLALQASDNNKKAYEIIEKMEKTLKGIILETLKYEYADDDSWWYQAVPQKIRKKILERIDEEHGGNREDYFDLIDFREIALKNWSLFQELLAYGKHGNKDARTEWIVKLNEMRKIVMHPAKERVIDWDQLKLLQSYSEWLIAQSRHDTTAEALNDSA